MKWSLKTWFVQVSQNVWRFSVILQILKPLFKDIFNIDIKGPLSGYHFKRRVKNWGETFNIDFNIILHKKRENNDCGSFVYVKYHEDLEEKDFEGKAGIWLCPDDKLSFESTKKDNYHSAVGGHVLTPNVEHHIQYKQFRQDDYNGELKRFVRIDNEIVLDREVNFTKSVDVTIHIADVHPYGSISNFKMSK